MKPENIEAITAVLGLLGGLIIWLWRTASSVTKAHVELGIYKSDVAELKKDQRELREQHVRTDTLMSTMSAKLDKLDQVDRLVASVESMRATVDRLDRLVVPRPEIEQLGTNLMERVRLCEERSLAHD